MEDKRLSIELTGMRQALWVDEVPSYVAYKPHGDELRWISTHLQLADCFTKSMKPTLLNHALDNNIVQVIDTSHMSVKRTASEPTDKASRS